MRKNAYIGFFLIFFLYGMPQSHYEHFSFKPYTSNSNSLIMGANAMFMSEERLEFVDYKITRLLIESGFNGNVLISHFGTLIYERSFGFSDLIAKEPLNLETSFQLASISKTFTASSVLLMQQQGLLHIDDTVKTHIPDFPYTDITIKHLLNHTSGLQNYMWLMERYWKDSVKPNNEDVLNMFITHKRPLNFTPGDRFEYSNTGYVFLGLLIERVSGKSLKDFVHENIFSPLEMHHSFVYDLHNPTDLDNRAYGYRQWRGKYILVPDDDLDGPLGDKGVFSNVYDLYKWDQAIYRNLILPANTWQQAFAYGTLSNDSTFDYGLGWRLQKYLDKQIVHHPGRWHGFRTSLKRFVDDHTTLVILSNNDMNLSFVIDSIQNILYAEEREIWLNHQFENQLQEEIELMDSLEDASSMIIFTHPEWDQWVDLPQ